MRFSPEWRLADVPEPSDDAPTVFSTFACGGGSTMGYKRAGYRALGCCEIDPEVNEVYRRNLHPRHNYVMDLRDFNRLDDLPDELHDLDVLDGSPPCTTFSVSGLRERSWGIAKEFKEGQVRQRLDDLFFVYLETVGKLRPKVSIAENVMGLVKGNARGYVSEILDAYRELGYVAQLFRVDAQFADVPQRRERVVFIANRLGKRVDLKLDARPIPFGEVRSERGVPVKGATSRRVIGMRRSGDASVKDTYERIGEHGRCFNAMYAYDDRPAPTVTARQDLIRFRDGEYISAEDTRRIGTFPADYDFGSDNRSKVRFLVGMSVPPNIMAHIASQVRTQLLDE